MSGANGTVSAPAAAPGNPETDHRQAGETRAKSLLGEVVAVLAGVLEIVPAEVTENSAIRELPNADSARILEAIVVVEDHFGVRIPDEALFHLETVSDLVDVLRRSAWRTVS